MRLHVVGLPHTETTAAYSWCAYTTKVRRFATMMTRLGHDVTLYVGEANEAECAEHVVCISRKEQSDLFGAPGNVPDFAADQPGFALFAERAIKGLRERVELGDFLCLSAGRVQQRFADAFPQMILTEPFVGYGGVLPHTFRAFESYAWMHLVYGALSGGDSHGVDGRFFDTVIPNFFDLEDFPLGNGDGGFLLYLGRLTERKGLAVVREVVERTGLPLVAAGAGDVSLLPPGTDYCGVVGPIERAEMLGGAVATLVPTLYVEPFGGVAVESMLCGTPAITTDWGAFSETVNHGVSGLRCRTLAEFCTAASACAEGMFDRGAVHHWAKWRYTTDVIGPRFVDWLERLATLRGDGWYYGAPSPPLAAVH